MSSLDRRAFPTSIGAQPTMVTKTRHNPNGRITHPSQISLICIGYCNAKRKRGRCVWCCAAPPPFPHGACVAFLFSRPAPTNVSRHAHDSDYLTQRGRGERYSHIDSRRAIGRMQNGTGITDDNGQRSTVNASPHQHHLILDSVAKYTIHICTAVQSWTKLKRKQAPTK